MHADDAPTRIGAPVLTASDARSTNAATAVLAALSASSVSASPVRAFIDDLAGMLPIRLTVHQRDRLEISLARALDAPTLQPAG